MDDTGACDVDYYTVQIPEYNEEIVAEEAIQEEEEILMEEEVEGVHRFRWSGMR